MVYLTKEEFEIFSNLVNKKQAELLGIMEKFLKNRYEKVIATDSFIYAVGDIPIALISHLDTVFEETEKTFKYDGKVYAMPKRVVELFYDQWKEVVAAPAGAGFDDRAGVYAIIKIIEAGLRPSVIFTTDEEIGGVGASKMVNQIKEPLSDLNYIIQLDRRGVDDCVFYDLEYPEFEQYISAYGFKKNWGSFTDISIICPAWNVAGVNLSIGYEHEHTTNEILMTKAWKSTIEKVTHMLKTVNEFKWEYKSAPKQDKIYPYWYDDELYYDNYFKNEDNTVTCVHCGTECSIYQASPVIKNDGNIVYYCLDCDERTDECLSCGNTFYQEKPSHKYCKDCIKEMRKFWKKKK